MERFEKGFFVGAATAAHQVEGNNIYSDAWAQEHMEHTNYLEPSGDSVDHYNHYEEDIKLLAEAGLNAYRFSIEWARIEPEEGKFDEKELEHYRQVIVCCKNNRVEPIVTLHHFTSPKWLISKGGWEADSVVEDFARYARFVMEHLGSELRYVCTINEANMGIQVAVIARRYMEQMKKGMDEQKKESMVQMGLNFEKMKADQRAAEAETLKIFGVNTAHCFCTPRSAHGDMLIMEAHKAARDVIHEICPEVKVGLTLSLHDIQAQSGGESNAEKEWAEEFTHYLPAIVDDDFLGVQNYTRMLMGPASSLPVPEGAETTQMDYEFYPQALGNVLRKVAKDFHGELLVTENGIATADDSRRIAFIEQAAEGVQTCIAEGLPIRGYIYWSLLDNFEWQKGYSMTFGLIAVDRSTQTRRPKPSLSVLGNYAAS